MHIEALIIYPNLMHSVPISLSISLVQKLSRAVVLYKVSENPAQSDKR